MRLRFHLRALVAAVAVAGVVLGAAVGGQRLRERSRSFRERAAMHELGRKVAAAKAILSVSTVEEKAAAKKTAAWRAARRDEYLRAAWFPWRDIPMVYWPPWEPPLPTPPAPATPAPAAPAVAARPKAADRGSPKYTPIPEANRATYADQMAFIKAFNPTLYAEKLAKYGPPGPPSAATAALVERVLKSRQRLSLPSRLGPRKPTRPAATEGRPDDPEEGNGEGGNGREPF